MVKGQRWCRQINAGIVEPRTGDRGSINSNKVGGPSLRYRRVERFPRNRTLVGVAGGGASSFATRAP